MPDLPQRPSLEHLRKQAKTRKRERGIGLSRAQHEIARDYGFDSWPKLVHHVHASNLEGIGRALMGACVERARAAGATVLCLHTVAMYEAMGFRRAPSFDFEGARSLKLKSDRRVMVIAYRLDLPASGGSW